MNTIMTTSKQLRPASTDSSFFGHPKGLMTLFSTEMWERFSYYGMRAILFYYLTDTLVNGGLNMSEAAGKATVATYSSSVFLLAILGGWVADRLWGPRRATLYGGVIIMLGHISLATPSAIAAFTGICLVALGTGLLKPNISTLVGELYESDDNRRDAAFSIFYMGINLGSFFSPIVVGWARSYGGYHLGFAIPAIGMALALVFYLHGGKWLSSESDRVASPITAEERPRLLRNIVLGIIGIVLFAGLVRLGITSGVLSFMTNPHITNIHVSVVTITLNLIAFAMPIVYFTLMFRSRDVTPVEKERLTAYIPLFIAAMIFWMIFEQAASSMAAFAEQNTDLTFFGYSFSPELYQSVNPLGIIIMASLFAALWTKLGDKPSTAIKFSIGIGLAGLSFIWLGSWASVYQGDALAPWWVLALTYVIQTVGELCLSPVGLAATTLLAPKAFKSQAMALWFLASASGQAITAFIFRFTADLPEYQVFLGTGIAALVATGILVALSPWITRHIRAVDENAI